MGRLSGRVAIVTGAGRGLGRSHALRLSAEGARVVVNDRGGNIAGEGVDRSAAEAVVEEIRVRGAEAVASTHDVADWGEAEALVHLAVSSFGALHVLVNNAGVLRDRTLANMTETEWDAVIRVHLKGHAAPTHHAMAYWKAEAKAGRPVQASVIHTSSLAGYIGNYGQANYAAAKLAVVALSRVASMEGAAIGVRSNVVSPSARSRLSLGTPASSDIVKPPKDPQRFDYFDPDNVSPLIAWLAAADCPATAQLYHIGGNDLYVFAMPAVTHHLRADRRWTLAALDRELSSRLVSPADVTAFLHREPAA